MTGYKDYLERMNTHTYEIVDGELPSFTFLFSSS